MEFENLRAEVGRGKWKGPTNVPVSGLSWSECKFMFGWSKWLVPVCLADRICRFTRQKERWILNRNTRYRGTHRSRELVAVPRERNLLPSRVNCLREHVSLYRVRNSHALSTVSVTNAETDFWISFRRHCPASETFPCIKLSFSLIYS